MIKFKIIGANGTEKAGYADTIPRVGEEILMTEDRERIRVTVYNVLYDLDDKTTRVFVR